MIELVDEMISQLEDMKRPKNYLDTSHARNQMFRKKFKS